MEIRYTEGKKKSPVATMQVEAMEGETCLSVIKVVATRPTRYHSQWIPIMTVGGVATPPEYRRSGCVRAMMEDLFQKSAEKGWVISVLHPFSFSYYRKFGYERVADHCILEFPMAALEHFPRVNEFVLLEGNERVADAVKVFEQFFHGRNLSFRRFGGEHLPTDPDLKKKACYLRYRNGEPVALVTLNLEKKLDVNHLNGEMLNVFELAFTDPEALRDIFGFLRMFEGEMDRITLHNCAMIPEVELMLRHYTHVSYRVVPDLMVKVLDTEKLLMANDFPQEAGRFVLGVEDSLPTVRGVFEVEYGDGKATVRRLADSPAEYTGATDLICQSGALAQILYGYYALTPQLLLYMEGVKVTGNPDDLIRAYPKQYNGLFEHF